MSFEAIRKDCSALLGYFHSPAGKIKIPALLRVKGNLLVGETTEGKNFELRMPDVVFGSPEGYFPAPLSFENVEEPWKVVGDWIVVIDWKKLVDFRGFKEEFCFFPRGLQLYQHPRMFVEAILEIRKAIGFGKLLYVPGIALPSRLAVLASLRIDVFDDALARFLGEKGVLTLPEGLLQCEEKTGDENFSLLEQELKVVERFACLGRLRELVEMRVRAEPELVALLRYMDLLNYQFFEKLWPVSGEKFYANSKESLHRVDVVRYRERLKGYRGVNASLLLLVPCSAKKPYHSSRSHMKIEEVLVNTGVRPNIHVVSLTSPLGVVPEELENFYPANAYDIPVTGHWDMEEKGVVIEGLKGFVGNYRHVLAYLPQDYNFVVEHFGLENACTAEVTSEESLEVLARRIDELNLGVGNPKKRLQEDVKNALQFQFQGIDTGFLEEARIKGKRWDWSIWLGDEAFRMQEEQGKILVLREGGKILASQGIKCVEIRDFEIKGDIFVPGIISASEDIRAGDEVVIVQNSMPVGTGTAVLSGIEMVELRKGLAVKMRERWKQEQK
ncbi:MAG: DUF5591 domain-containing protein [Thermoplasmata archaeon]